jgi:hypothetical protein
MVGVMANAFSAHSVSAIGCFQSFALSHLIPDFFLCPRSTQMVCSCREEACGHVPIGFVYATIALS